jgi:hypothetical protein
MHSMMQATFSDWKEELRNGRTRTLDGAAGVGNLMVDSVWTRNPCLPPWFSATWARMIRITRILSSELTGTGRGSFFVLNYLHNGTV